jgi:hypothetical protein
MLQRRGLDPAGRRARLADQGQGHSDRRRQGDAAKWAGTRNPKPANYVPRKRRGGGSFRMPADDSKLRQALEDIANGHNDARRRAKDALGLP